jgi:hypothetical protein
MAVCQHIGVRYYNCLWSPTLNSTGACIARDIHFAMFPVHDLTAYKDWERLKHERFARIGQSRAGVRLLAVLVDILLHTRLRRI